jgi:hypothetical protein
MTTALLLGFNPILILWQDTLKGGSACRKGGQHKHRINTDTNASSGIQTHDPSIHGS